MEQWIPHKRETWPWILGRLKRQIGNLDKGKLIRIVMVSRFGDVGITPILEDSHGYVARVALSDIEREL